MPLYKFPSGAEGLIEFYTEYDENKPTVAILPPTLGYSALYQDYIKDPELAFTYNIIGLEISCSHGSTKSVADSRYDQFVGAAELAFMLNAFKIPPVHLFAPEAQAPHLSFCLVAAFPERVASIMVLGGYPLREAHRQTFWEMAPSHFNPWNEERWFEVLHALVDMIYGPQQHSITPDALDALIDADARTCINRPEVIYLTWKCFLERDWAPEKVLPQIPCDVLFVQPRVNPADGASELATDCQKLLPPHRVEIHYMEDAPPGLALACPNEVLPTLKNFLQRQHKDFKYVPSDNSKALQRVQDLFFGYRDVDFRGRDPNDPFSFSVFTPELVRESGEALVQLLKDHKIRKRTPCPHPYGQGPEPWSHSVDELSARFTHRNCHDAEKVSRRQSAGRVVIDLHQEEGYWKE